MFDNVVVRQIFETLGERAGIEPSNGTLEVRKAAFASSEITQNEGSPFAANNFRTCGDTAGTCF